MKKPVFTFWISLRLIWGGLLNPMLDIARYIKFFPPARRAVNKNALADYFFRN